MSFRFPFRFPLRRTADPRRPAFFTFLVSFAIFVITDPIFDSDRKLVAAELNKSASSNEVDFRTDIIPILTKHGCNSGACHGAAIGRGGFKLSLYGGDPSADLPAITMQLNGRRINLSDPELSLLFLKPTEYVAHGGGTIFDADSTAARQLKSWLYAGAPDSVRRVLTDLTITPKRYVAGPDASSTPLRAVANYSDGSSRDVTQWTIFKANDESAVELSENAADGNPSSPAISARVLRPGRHLVVARYLNQVVPLEFLLPFPGVPASSTSPIEPSSFIDLEILETLKTLNLPTTQPANDSTFLRRIYLDLTGRLPTKQDVLAYQNDTDVGKNKKLVDALLQSPEFSEFWTLQFAQLLRVRPLPKEEQGAETYHRWIAEQIRSDASYQQMVRDLILSSGDTHKIGPANFYRTVKGQRELTEFASELFMGSRLRCANCHNHPLDRWTQDDYHGLAAIFAKVESGRVIADKPTGQNIHPRDLEPARERLPGADFLQTEKVSGREQFANWLADESNPYFSKAIVNRLWRHMMGRGLVEPVDDFRDTNPATHPRLLSKLADDFAKNGFKLRHTLKTIALSQAYARGPSDIDIASAEEFYSAAARRPLKPEVLADAISDVLGLPDQYGDLPLGTRAVSLMNPKTPSPSLDILGRCDRTESCESAATSTQGLPQKLHLFNGQLINARIATEGGRLRRLLDEQRSASEIVQEFYLVALGRVPNEQEARFWQRELESADDRQAAFEDFVWAIVSCQEFVTNH